MPKDRDLRFSRLRNIDLLRRARPGEGHPQGKVPVAAVLILRRCLSLERDLQAFLQHVFRGAIARRGA